MGILPMHHALEARRITPPATAYRPSERRMPSIRQSLAGLRDLLTQLRDLPLLSFHQRVELPDLHGVVALFVFAEAAEVGFVGRAVAMEEEFVFLDDQLAELFFLGRI